jgi:hypothetical protein
MSDDASPFAWEIDEQRSWPPHKRPEPPFGVTAIEVLRSCPLRVMFDTSHGQGYERRVGPAARVGLAFHRTLQWLFEDGLSGLTQEERAERARRQFLAELAAQEAERQTRPRERGLPPDEQRIKRALEAIMAEARQSTSSRVAKRQPTTSFPTTTPPLADRPNDQEPGTLGFEIHVQSAEGLMTGRIDRVEQTENGVRIVDYKSALRDDLPERYERQLQLYAWMWHDTTGEWPAEALLVYPFTGTVHEVRIDEPTCETVATESASHILDLQKEQPPLKRGRPGEVCQVCEYRPWCHAFWDWQSAEPSHRTALEKAYYGFEGQLVALENRDLYWKLGVQWRNCITEIKVPAERFPQLVKAKVGDWVRVLDVRLHGQMYSPRGVVSEWSEFWLVR